jgi:hypothetical protein
MELQTIPAGRAIELAADLADHLAKELEGVNQKYPGPGRLAEASHDLLMWAYSRAQDGPTPSDSVPVFKRLFLTYIASKYVIVPDQP